MEASLCYIAARMPLDRVVQGLGLVLGAPSDHRIADGDWIAHLHDTGFTLLWCEDEGYAFRQQAQLARLSMQGTVYSVQISEAMMAAEAVCYEGGTEAWHVLHQGTDGDLEASTTCAPADPSRNSASRWRYNGHGRRRRQRATPSSTCR
jgi:hypothetical protein